MIERNNGTPKVVPFEPTQAAADTLEMSGQAIVARLKEAAAMSREACQRAIDRAEQLATKLRAAENAVKESESEARHYEARAMQAENWLARIHQEVQDGFFDRARSQ